jgi:hypothetical protein
LQYYRLLLWGTGRNVQNKHLDLLSSFRTGDDKSHTKQELLYPASLGNRMSIDET